MSHSGEPNKMPAVLEDVAEEAEPEIRSEYEVGPRDFPLVHILSGISFGEADARL